MIVINLQKSKTIDPVSDCLGRHVKGWNSSMTLEQLYEAGRGCFKLNIKRAKKEKYLLFAAEGKFRGAIEITNIIPIGTKYAFEGKILREGNEIFDAYVNHPITFNSNRNPVYYMKIYKYCKCGCGQEIDKDFCPGHDQRAIHQRISSQFKSVAEFIDWFDDHFA